MKINLKEIPKDGLFLEEEKTGTFLGLEQNDIIFSWPVQIKADVNHEHNNIKIHIVIRSRIQLQCSRCLKDYEQDLKKEIDMIKSIGEETVIDLTQIVREEIILDYPVKLLCKEDCNGLCSLCGKNLNEGDCDCKEGKKSFRGISVEKSNEEVENHGSSKKKAFDN